MMAVDMEVMSDSSPPCEEEKKRGKAKERDMVAESDRDVVVVEGNTTRQRERKKAREDDDVVTIPAEAIKFKLKDVTKLRTALQPIDDKGVLILIRFDIIHVLTFVFSSRTS